MAPAMLQAKLRRWSILLGAVNLENGSRNTSVTSEVLSYPLRLCCRSETRPESNLMLLVISADVSLDTTIQHRVVFLKCLGRTILVNELHHCCEVFAEFMELA